MRIDLNQELSDKVLNRHVNEFINPVDPLLHVDMTLEEAIKLLKLKPPSIGHFRAFYVVDAEGSLKGIITARDLLLGDPKAKLAQVLDEEIVKAKCDDSLRESLEILSYYQLFSIPVVDRENKLKGILEIVPVNFEGKSSLKARNLLWRDLFQFIGFSIEQHRWSSPWKGYCIRMPWLLCNLFAGLACAGIAHVFQESLVQFVILALFIPLVLTLCESAATQSMTLMLQILHQPRLRRKQLLRRLHMEWKTVLLLGVTSGIAAALSATIWGTGWKVLAAIGSSVFVSMLVAASFGTLFPAILKKLRLDPKVASGPLILMFTDISATTIYLGLSTLWLVTF